MSETESNNPSKRVRIDESNTSQTPLLVSLPTSLKSEAEKASKKLEEIQQQYLKAVATAKALKNNDYVPKSVKNGFELTASDRLKSDFEEDFERITTKLTNTKKNHEKELIGIMLEMKEFEVKALQNERAKILARTLSNLAKFWQLQYDNNNEITTHSDELVYWTLEQHCFSIFTLFEFASPDDFYIEYNKANGLKDDPRPYLPNAASQGSINKEKKDVEDRFTPNGVILFKLTIDKYIYTAIQKVINDQKANYINEKIKKQARLIAKTTATASTANDLQSELNSSNKKNLTDYILTTVKTELKKDKQKSTKQPTTKKEVAKNGKGGSKRKETKKDSASATTKKRHKPNGKTTPKTSANKGKNGKAGGKGKDSKKDEKGTSRRNSSGTKKQHKKHGKGSKTK